MTASSIPASTSGTAELRRFARTFTRRVGALEEQFLGRDRPLGSARLLWEIGSGGAEVGDLRRRLDLDSGYLSRLLRALEVEGLVLVGPDPTDGRRRRAALTDLGVMEWLELDHRSDLVAGALVADLPPRAAARLVALLGEADLLLRADEIGFDVVDPRSEPAMRGLRAYVTELDARFDDGFDVEAALGDPGDSFREPVGRFVVAQLGDDVVACGGVRRLHDSVAEVKRMWVDPRVRGVGLGRRLLARLEHEAVELGARTVRLDTNRALGEAIAMYGALGYVEIERYNDNVDADHWFERVLVE